MSDPAGRVMRRVPHRPGNVSLRENALWRWQRGAGQHGTGAIACDTRQPMRTLEWGMAEATDWNSKIIEEFRANGGKIGGQFQGAPLLLLHTVGAKTGKERVNPMMYLAAGDDRVAVFASKAGAPTNPDWYHNLLANPGVRAEIGTRTVSYTARVAKGEERERLWAEQKRAYPGFAGYEKKTARQIPVVVLEPTRD